MSTPSAPPTPAASSAFSAATVPTLRAATAADLPAVERLLAATGLPAAAVAGLEVCCDNALLRSVAVQPAWRRHGLGQALVRRVVCGAEERGLRALYLLTMTAEHYFPRLGFAPVARDAVPAEIAATLEFRSACPAAAVAMARPLQPPPA